LDQIYSELGYYLERNGAITFEGAEGAAKIQKLLASYAQHPPDEMLGTAVMSLRNFAQEIVRDVEGDEIPKEMVLIFELADKTRVAVRGSGTEPKIKYYLFAQRRPRSGSFTPAELSEKKAELREKLEMLWEWLQRDAEERVGG
jgi:phosphoglucomutase